MRTSLLLILCVFLAGCCSLNAKYPKPGPVAQGAVIGAASGAVIGSIATGTGPGTVVGGVVGGMLGSVVGDSIARHKNVQEDIKAHDIQLIEVGDSIKIVIPSDGYYFSNSPRLNPHYYAVLDKVAEFMRDIPKASVKVSAFTDNKECEARSLALTRERARSMASYLWKQGIDTRLIYPAGFGANYPIAHNQTIGGRAENRRVEISFRRITPDASL